MAGQGVRMGEGVRRETGPSAPGSLKASRPLAGSSLETGSGVLLAAPWKCGVLKPWRQPRRGWAHICHTNIRMSYFSLLRPNKLTGTLNSHAPTRDAFADGCTHLHTYAPFLHTRV